MTATTMIELKSIPFDENTDFRDTKNLPPDIALLVSDVAASKCSAAIAVGATAYMIMVPTETLPEFTVAMKYWFDREGDVKVSRPPATGAPTCETKEVARLERELEEAHKVLALGRITVDLAAEVVKDLLAENAKLKAQLGK